MSKPTKVLEHKRRHRANTVYPGSDEGILRHGPHDAHCDPDLRLMDCPSVPGLTLVLRLAMAMAMAAARTGDLA
jgi:hypothetical protein